MAGYLRLRQICLVAPELEPAVADFTEIFSVPVCYRDPNVAQFGLVNALFAFGTSFIEVVAPVQENTAAGRFLERSRGRGGYMAIFDCNDPERRKRHAEAIGVRIAWMADRPDYLGVQLHPRDCRAAMIEFNRSPHGEDIRGAYHPAGEHWTDFVKTDVTKALVEAEVESPDPAGIAAHWSKITEVPLAGDRLVFAAGAVRFVPAADGKSECLSALSVAVADPARVAAAAARRGHKVANESFDLCGVHIKLQRA
jgi:hypothetical protein